MIERKQDRRQAPALPMAVEQRRPFDRRGRHERADVVPALPGTVRPGYGEVPPPRERRQRPESGME
jgi:hypothetical protein